MDNTTTRKTPRQKRTNAEIIALIKKAKEMEAQGYNRTYIEKVTGLMSPTIVRYLGKKYKKTGAPKIFKLNKVEANPYAQQIKVEKVTKHETVTDSINKLKALGFTIIAPEWVKGL